MIPITLDEDRAALNVLIANTRAELAQFRRLLQLHRDILQSPPDRVAQIEQQALRSADAVAWLEHERAEINQLIARASGGPMIDGPGLSEMAVNGHAI